MIDENSSRIPIWLLWARSDNGLVTLVAVTLTQRRAVTCRKILLRRFVSVRIEKSEANHLYDPQLDAIWESMYGPDYIRDMQKRAVQIVASERDLLRDGYSNLLGAAALAIQTTDFSILKDCMIELQRKNMIADYL